MLLPHFQKMLALYNRYKGLPNFAPTHSPLDSFAAVVRQRSPPLHPPISWRALHNTLMTAAKETKSCHYEPLSGRKWDRWQFLWIVAWRSILRKSGGKFSARYLSRRVSRGIRGDWGGGAVPGCDLPLLDTFQSVLKACMSVKLF